jgi:hypothetical protein
MSTLPEWITAIAALIAALATVGYFIYTIGIFREAKRSADAAEGAAAATADAANASKENARAAKQSAEVAQRSIELASQQFAQQLGQAPDIVIDAILATQELITYWKNKAQHIAQPPNANPDPKALDSPLLLAAIPHARIFSSACAVLLSQAHAHLKNAQSELEAAFRAARSQTFGPPRNDASTWLECAQELLNAAHHIALAQHIQTTPQTSSEQIKTDKSTPDTDARSQ